ncbi:MAG: hypothetical protein JKX98_12685 [Alcanivoracaceae bacterium]|nr:hypothetical protein [Alcanivoracaceae bacterium]
MKNRKTNSIIKVVAFFIVILSISNLANATQGTLHMPPKGLSALEWNDIQQQINQQKLINNNETNQAGAGSNYTIDAYIKASNTGANDFFGYAPQLKWRII